MSLDFKREFSNTVLSLFKLITRHTTGQVILPHQYRKDVIFLPQTPYMTYGSLRDQLVYPHQKMAASVTNADILRVLKLVRLEHLTETIEDFDQVYTLDWTKMLSPGEQQKMAFARLFYAKPMFAGMFFFFILCILSATAVVLFLFFGWW